MQKFIKLHIVSQKPGNPLLEAYLRADSIISINKSAEEFAKIGAATSIDNSLGTMYVSESVDEVHDLLEEALKETV